MQATCTSTLNPEVESQAPEAAPAAGRPIQVLMVEDDPEAAALVQHCLKQEGPERFCVEWETTLQAAMERIAEPGLDVVLLDLGMPDLSGAKSYIAVAIAARDNLPIVIYTGNENVATRDLTLGFGAADYLVKHKCSSTQLRRALCDAVRYFRPGHLHP